jgi:hypothetical protein
VVGYVLTVLGAIAALNLLAALIGPVAAKRHGSLALLAGGAVCLRRVLVHPAPA